MLGWIFGFVSLIRMWWTRCASSPPCLVSPPVAYPEVVYKSADYDRIVSSFDESAYGVASWAHIHVRSAHVREDATKLREQLAANNIQELAEHLFEYMVAMYRDGGIELEHLDVNDCRTWLAERREGLIRILDSWSEAPHRFDSDDDY